MTAEQEATVILEVNCHSKSPGVSVWVVLGKYDDNDLDSPDYAGTESARKLVGPVPPGIGQELQRNSANLLGQVGLKVTMLEAADD